jgi:hypothetical protein
LPARERLLRRVQQRAMIALACCCVA